jgi:long-chain acyl-CoA synthetase
MTEYFNSPEENAIAFEDGYFKTGDLVKFDDEGYMYIVGRIKEIIVLSNGENVSPAHIETKINTLEFIQDSLVTLVKNELGAEILQAEVILRPMIMAKLNVENPLAMVETEIEKINATLFDYERIAKVVIRTEDFERSPSMKIIRPKQTM